MEGLHACVGLGTGAKGELRDCVLSSSGLDGVAAYGEGTEVDARNCKLVCNALGKFLPCSTILALNIGDRQISPNLHSWKICLADPTIPTRKANNDSQ